MNWEDEAVLITGGLGGLGGLIAEVYGMRGVPVAVLDVRELSEAQKEELEERGVRYWRCDVGSREEVERTVRGVREEVRLFISCHSGCGCDVVASVVVRMHISATLRLLRLLQTTST